MEPLSPTQLDRNYNRYFFSSSASAAFNFSADSACFPSLWKAMPSSQAFLTSSLVAASAFDVFSASWHCL